VSNKKWVPSRFNAISRSDDGELILYNSYTGAIASFDGEEQPIVMQALKRQGVEGELTPLLTALHESGFIVSDQVDEDQRAQFLHQSLHRTDYMHLIVMPTEACNFRCTYCYQSFPRGKMTEDMVEGVKNYVKQKARTLSKLNISWFGGEPLLAPDVIASLSESIMDTAKTYGIEYEAEITTNGFYLKKELFIQLLGWNVRRYMVTLDGPRDFHDKKRVQAGGGSTFEQIVGNLKQMQTVDENYEVYIRVNFDEDNLEAIPEFITYLAEQFDGDPRFQTFFRPVGKWGGPHDDDLPVCDHNTAQTKIWEYTELGLNQGIPMSSMIESSMMPTGSVCYAAKPNSLVIGPDGQLYKCTISFEEDFNQVGQLYKDGSVDLDYDKIAVWVTSGEEKDAVCQSCFYRPACQGNHCPLYRMRTGERPCPHEKKKIKTVLKLIWQQYNKAL
jgi:uncharacterized protein